jgi:hypothetical protein
LYTAFSTGDIQTILDNVNSNAEWINHGPETIPYAGNSTAESELDRLLGYGGCCCCARCRNAVDGR